MLFRILQKYKFESKSQQAILQDSFAERCLEYYKNTNLKANHNYEFGIAVYSCAV